MGGAPQCDLLLQPEKGGQMVFSATLADKNLQPGIAHRFFGASIAPGQGENSDFMTSLPEHPRNGWNRKGRTTAFRGVDDVSNTHGNSVSGWRFSRNQFFCQSQIGRLIDIHGSATIRKADQFSPGTCQLANPSAQSCTA